METLPRYQPAFLFIDGKACAAAAGRSRAVINPATEDTLGDAPEAGEQDVGAAVAAAERGFVIWRDVSSYERANILRRIGALLRERADSIGQLLTLEVGKPFAEARAEIRGSADHFDWCAEEGRRIYGYTIAGRQAASRIRVDYQPVGIVLALTPWNFPIAMAARKVAAALAAGCSVILRPAEESPASSAAFIKCCHDGGIPSGAINLLLGPPDRVVAPLMSAPSVRHVTFTGSTRVGKILIADSARTVKRLTLELGGHAPVIVLQDANIKSTAIAAAQSKFRNAGQVCVAPSRFFVHEHQVEEFARVLAEATKKIVKIGDGFSEGVTMGPLSTARQRAHVEDLVEDAQDKGAKLVIGGRRPSAFNRGFFYEPTVISNVPHSAKVLSVEPFGPIAPVISYSNVDEAIRMANAVECGLAGYVFTRSLDMAHRVADKLETGVVGINNFTAALAEGPFGGIKESGYGREGGIEGIREFVASKLVHATVSDSSVEGTFKA